MKRMWLTWNGNKITAVWKGRLWKVAMDGDPEDVTGFKLYMRAEGKTEVVVPWTWDTTHRKRPEWVDIPEAWQDMQESASSKFAGLFDASDLIDPRMFDAAEGILDEAARMGVSPDDVLRMAAYEITESDDQQHRDISVPIPREILESSEAELEMHQRIDQARVQLANAGYVLEQATWPVNS